MTDLIKKISNSIILVAAAITFVLIAIPVFAYGIFKSMERMGRNGTRREHPTLSTAAVRQIVKDHLKKKR